MSPWTVGDIVSVIGAVPYAPLGRVIQPRYRNPRGLVELLGTGLSLATLMLVLLDPFRQMLGFTTSLLAIALDEGRATLWLSAAVAAIYLVKDGLVQPKGAYCARYAGRGPGIAKSDADHARWRWARSPREKTRDWGGHCGKLVDEGEQMDNGAEMR